MMLKNTNCYLVKGYENGVHCQRAPFVHFSSTKTRLSVRYDATWTHCLTQVSWGGQSVLRFTNST